ncbi:MAG: TonB-dependent receptor [Alphaproteobacteria bacterium]|nr:TonB-dependent receptor [Alphaproteobacteria bacterium]
MRLRAGLAVLGLVVPPAAWAEQTVAPIEQVVVTATRLPEPVDQIPADISVVGGDELLARDATDLRSGLSLVSGVEAPPGGDAGPSSAVPSFWGLHEFDAFLLVVDGVPWGGAFNPAIPSLDLTDASRIEILKGAAPVMYGATSFVGVVQMLHYPAGQAANQVEAAYGSFGSWRGSASFVLPPMGDYVQSLAVSGQTLGFADHRETVNDGHLLYRGAAPLAGGTIHVDAEVTLIHDLPPSPIVRAGDSLNPITPINANYQPADAKMSENRFHLALDFTRATELGEWETLVSFAHSDIRDVRGFLRPDLTDNGSANADSQNQSRQIEDLYVDTHVAKQWNETVSLLVGADLLYGSGIQASRNGEYYVPLDGLTIAPPTWSLHVDEINSVNDRRLFAGQYAQVDWKPGDRLDIVAGLRLNETGEQKDSTHIDGFDNTLDTFDSRNRDVVRLSETLGASYRLWSSGADEGVFYADYRDAFKPAAVDFGPDNTPDILQPETARSYEAGFKGRAADGRLQYQLDAFVEDFSNLVVPNPITGDLENAAKERLEGADFQARYLLARDLALAGSFAFHDARYTRFTTVDDLGNPENVDGRELALSPRVLAAAGFLYTPAQGLEATLVANYVGHRWLNEENTAPAGGYVTVDVTLGYRLERYELMLEAANLTNQRAVVSASEFGSRSFYLLPAQSLWLKLAAKL